MSQFNIQSAKNWTSENQRLKVKENDFWFKFNIVNLGTQEYSREGIDSQLVMVKRSLALEVYTKLCKIQTMQLRSILTRVDKAVKSYAAE